MMHINMISLINVCNIPTHFSNVCMWIKWKHINMKETFLCSHLKGSCGYRPSMRSACLSFSAVCCGTINQKCKVVSQRLITREQSLVRTTTAPGAAICTRWLSAVVALFSTNRWVIITLYWLSSTYSLTM